MNYGWERSVNEIRNYRRDLSLQLPELLRMGEVNEIRNHCRDLSLQLLELCSDH
jgi:hypothetical protein